MYNLSNKSIIGTSLQGYVYATVNQMIELFGEPHYIGKNTIVSHDWVLENENEDVLTIYEYWTENVSSDIIKWHIGAKNSLVALDLINYINESLKLTSNIKK